MNLRLQEIAVREFAPVAVWWVCRSEFIRTAGRREDDVFDVYVNVM